MANEKELMLENGLTDHYAQERGSRDALIRQNGGYGKRIACIYWDKGHINGPEYHVLTDNAIIAVFNVRTKRLVTTKFARPGQIRQLDGKINLDDANHPFYHWNIPSAVMRRAEFYERNGMNNW